MKLESSCDYRDRSIISMCCQKILRRLKFLITSTIFAFLILNHSPLFAQEIIDSKSGRLFVTHIDLTLPAGPINLDIERSLYQQEEGTPGLLGNRWRMNWERKLLRLGPIALINGPTWPVAYDQKGKSEEYQSLGGGRITFKEDGSAIHQRRDGIKETFDTIGRLIGMEYPNGNKAKLTYISVGQISRIDGPRGHFIEFAYNEQGRLKQIKSSMGDIVDYTYDHDNLAMVRDNIGYWIKYGYGKNGELNKVERPETGAIWFEYDPEGRVVTRRWSDDSKERFEYDNATQTYKHISPSGSVTTTRWSQDSRRQEIIGPLGNKSVIDYDEHSRCSTITNPMGKISHFTYDELGRTATIKGCCGSSLRYEYLDDTSHIKKVIDETGSQQEYDYDLNRNLTTITNADGSRTQFIYYPDGLLKSVVGPAIPEEHLTYHPDGSIASSTNAIGETIRYEYDKRGNIIQEIDPLGGVTHLTYNEYNQLISIIDPTGAKTSYAYDPHGRILEEIDALGSVTRYAYDIRGRLTSETDPAGNKTTYRYNPNGHLESEVDALGNTFHYEYDSVGQLIRENNPLGGITSTTYDAVGRVIMATTPSGENIKYLYTDDGNIRKIESPVGEVTYNYDSQGFVNMVSDTAGRKITYVNNAKGHLTKVVYPSGLIKEFSYDPSGNLTSSTDNRGMRFSFEYDKLGRIVGEQRSPGLSSTYQYDVFGNVIGTKDSLGATISMKYNGVGNLIKTTNSMGYVTHFKYDRLENLVEKIDPLGNAKRMAYNSIGDISEVIEATGDTAKYEYDALSRVVKVYHPGGGITQYDYDPIGNLVRSINPLNGSHQNVYDKAGYLVSSMDVKGQTTTFAYDDAGRLLKKHLSDGKEIHYQYDDSNNITEVDDGVFPIRYTYDTAGRLIQIAYPAIKRTLKYGYNESGLLSAFTDSEGQTVKYGYDDFGRLKTMSKPDGFAIDFSYDTRDRLIGADYPNGVKGKWEYDTVGQLSAITYTDKEGIVVDDWRYHYDPAGNLTEIRSSGGKLSRYRYDQSGQIIEENIPTGKIKYIYGLGGNRSKRLKNGKTVEYEYNAADQLLKAGDETFKYDANGNLVERQSSAGVTRYVYDADNRLVKVTKPDGSGISFGYGPTGERIWREDANGRTWFVTDGTNLLAELDENLSAKSTYIHAPGIDRPLAMNTDGMVYFFHPKALGTIAFLTGKKGKIAASYETDAFGNPLEEKEDIRNSFIFTGREYEVDIGLYYYRARYYDPKLGRFITPDVHPPDLERPFSFNQYIYVSNTPTAYIDPMGTEQMNWDDILGEGDPFYTPDPAFLEAQRQLRHAEANTPPPKPEKIDYPHWKRNYGISKRNIDRVIKLRQTVLGESRTRAVDNVERHLWDAEFRTDHTPKGMIKHVVNEVTEHPKYQRNVSTRIPSSASGPPPASNLPGGQRNIGGNAGRQPALETVPEGPGRGPRQTRIGRTRLGEGSPGRAPRQTRIAFRPNAERPSIGSDRENWLKRFVSGPTGKVMEFVKNNPGKIVLVIKAAQYAACKSRGMSTEDCIIEAVISAGIGKGLTLAAGKIIVVLGPTAGVIATRAFIVGGALYGTFKIVELGLEAKGAMAAESDRQKLLAAEVERIEELLKKNGKLDQTIANTQTQIDKELKGPLDSYQKACQAAQKHVQAAKQAALEAHKNKQELVALAARIRTKAEVAAKLWADAVPKKAKIDATYTKMTDFQNRVIQEINFASQLAQSCTSAQDGEKIKELYGSAKGLSDGMRQKVTEAASLNQELKELKTKVCEVNNDLGTAKATKDKITNIAASFEQLRVKAQPDLDRAYDLKVNLSKQCDAWEGRVNNLVRSLTYGLVDHGDFKILERVESKLAPLRAKVNTFRNTKCILPNLSDILGYAADANLSSQDAAGVIQDIGNIDLELCNAMPTADSVVANIETTAALAWAAVVKGEGLPQKSSQCGKNEGEGKNPFEDDPMGEKSRQLQANKKTKRGKAINEGLGKEGGGSKGGFTLNKMDKEREKIHKKMSKPPECTNNDDCEKRARLVGETGWTCDPKTKKCVRPEKKEPKPECEDAQCEADFGTGWKCNEKGDCVGPEEKEKGSKCDNAECQKKGRGWKCNKSGECVGPEDKKEKIAKKPEKPKTKKPKSKPKPKKPQKPKKEPTEKPVKYCPGHTFCDKVGIAWDRALDVNKDGVCDHCKGKISENHRWIITWPDSDRRPCPEHDR